MMDYRLKPLAPEFQKPYLCDSFFTDGALAQLARARDWQSRGRRFDSAMLHTDYQAVMKAFRNCFFVLGDEGVICLSFCGRLVLWVKIDFWIIHQQYTRPSVRDGQKFAEDFFAEVFGEVTFCVEAVY